MTKSRLNEKFISYTRQLLQDWERGGFIYCIERNTEIKQNEETEKPVPSR